MPEPFLLRYLVDRKTTLKGESVYFKNINYALFLTTIGLASYIGV